MTDPALSVSHGYLLGGRVRYAQPVAGFRSGIEPVMLAAAIPAKAGERILEAGPGAGAALLCLMARIPGIEGVGVERDPALARLAQANADDNAWPNLRFVAGDIVETPLDGVFDHACTNPPYHAATGTRSPDDTRERAKRLDSGLLARWAVAMGRALRHRGTLTFILPAGLVPEACTAMAMAHCQPSVLFPLWPRHGQPAGLVILQSIRNGRGTLRISPGLVLHAAGQAYTEHANASLRDGAALQLD